jgi:predicted dehydrogenase
MDSPRRIRRRSFLGRSAALGLGAVAAPAVFSSASRILGANEKIILGILGSGGRGRNVMRKHMEFGCEFPAVCDVYAPNLERGIAEASPSAKGYHDYRAVLELPDIDAVLIGSPEHLHAPMLIDAVAAGKDAYCEKPMSHSIEEGLRMIKAVRRTDRIVQIGMQRRSSPSVHAAKELVKDCGEIYLVEAYWNWDWARPLSDAPLEGKLDWEAFVGPAPSLPFDPKRFRYWRYFWDYSGGNCTDQGTHLMDVVQWFMGVGTPRAASCHGGVFVMKGSETPDVFVATYEYEGFLAKWTLDYKNTMDNGWNIKFLGSKGTLWLDNEGARLYESRDTGTTYNRTEKPHLIKEIKEPLSDREHIANFIECVRSRKEPNAPVEVGHTAVCGPHLANVAFHQKTQARLNETATRVTVG